LPYVIFSPGRLALDLAENLKNEDIEVTIYTPGPIDSTVASVHADMTYFSKELEGRGDSYIELLKKHPFTFVSLARQVQSEIIAKAFKAANDGKHDIVHVYTNEEDTALPFSSLCIKPVIFTHHDPFNFLIKYKNVFPKYPYLNWLSLSFAQRTSMPATTNWIGNIYHGLNSETFTPIPNPSDDYIAYLGRIIEPKGVHLAIDAIKEYNRTAKKPLKLKIAGKHYSDSNKDSYWQNSILPRLDDTIEYVGFLKTDKEKQLFLANAKALIVPSVFNEPFGMVLIESLACGTPIIGLNSGAIPEIITSKNGILVTKKDDERATILDLSKAVAIAESIDRKECRLDFEKRFTIERMAHDHANLYRSLLIR
jgi:glycosyltransferase involved in cell wall biosynthesis